jgi:hypothetical protein
VFGRLQQGLGGELGWQTPHLAPRSSELLMSLPCTQPSPLLPYNLRAVLRALRALGQACKVAASERARWTTCCNLGRPGPNMPETVAAVATKRELARAGPTSWGAENSGKK